MIDIILTSNKRGGFVPIEAGSYRAVCYMVVVLGTAVRYEKPTKQVVFFWELPDERIERDGVDKPKSIYAVYNCFMSPGSNLQKMLESWRGKAFTDEELDANKGGGFSLSKVLGAPCMLAVTSYIGKEGNEKSKVSSVTRLPKSMAVEGGAENPLMIFDITNDDCPLEEMEKLPEWVQNRIKESMEYKRRTTSPDDYIVANDEDLPFD